MNAMAALLGFSFAGSLIGAGANLYSQKKQRDLYRYEKAGYERQYADWKKNTPGRSIKYPEFSYPGHIRRLETGISQSYASSVGSIAGLGRSVSSYGRRSRSLYSNSTGYTSRYL